MRIKIDPHTLERAQERGASEQEILDVIRHGTDISAKFGRLGKAKVYEFNQKRGGRNYEQKRIEVFYVVEGMNIITVTVYVFYGRWGEK